MKRLDAEIKVGIDRQDFVNREKAEQFGFDIQETDNHVYAVKTESVEVTESEAEMLDNYETSELIDLVQKHEYKRAKDALYNEARAMLQQKVPAAVRDAMETLEAMGVDTDSIPYEFKVSKEKLLAYVKQNS